MDEMKTVDRGALNSYSFDEADQAEVDFWLQKSPAERIEAIMELRRWAYGEDAEVDRGLQRLLTHVELGRN